MAVQATVTQVVVVQVMSALVVVVQVMGVQVVAVQVVRAQVLELMVGVEVPEEVEANPEVVTALLLTTSAGNFNWPVLLCSRS